MKVAITGARGMVGSALTSELEQRGDKVVRLVRREAQAENEVSWDPDGGGIDTGALPEVDAIVHLAGENIASRWTAKKKRAIRDSRVDGTRALAESLAAMDSPPRVLVSASAIGYYGDRGDEVLTESSDPGDSFLAEVTSSWEAANEPARAAGIRCVQLRFGLILSADGGALKTMLFPFKLGLGGRVGDGKQYWSWVSLADVVAGILFAIEQDGMSGPVNMVAPGTVRNSEFTRVLGTVLGRPTIFPVPAFGARLMLGEMAEGLLLASARVQPVKLEEAGYEFRHTDLETALRSILDREKGG